MKLSILLLTLFAALATFTSCRSTHDDTRHEADDVPCTCGDPATMFDGCACPLCASGQGNPANPDCACGQIHIGAIAK